MSTIFHREKGSNMKRHGSFWLIVVMIVGLMLLSVPRLSAQSDGGTDADDRFNPPPFDFNDAFYTANGINVQALDQSGAGRFGLFRRTGPPAGPGQVNWVVDNSNTDPTKKNIRILATTGGYIDDGTGAPTDFISIIAFLLDQSFFTGVANARGIQMQDIVSHFEAYAAIKQIGSDHIFRPQPCLASIGQTTNCFPVDSVATPRLRQDWRFASNRNAIDGSDGNDPLGNISGTVSDSPFGYFCDDLLGIWIITYFYYTDTGFGPNQTANCKQVLANIAAVEGLSLDGSPIIKTADELNNQLEANGCGAEFQLDAGGADGGAVWLICPTIPDPRNGAIARDAFLDSVHLPNGAPLDPAITANFNCLQRTGKFPVNGVCQ
jgi:hypothetical protein